MSERRTRRADRRGLPPKPYAEYMAVIGAAGGVLLFLVLLLIQAGILDPMPHLLSTILITLAATILLGVVAGLGDWSATALLGGMTVVGALCVGLLVRADRAHHE